MPTRIDAGDRGPGIKTGRASDLTDIRQGAYDPIIAPARIFPRHLHHQAFCFLIYFGAPYTSTEF